MSKPNKNYRNIIKASTCLFCKGSVVMTGNSCNDHPEIKIGRCKKCKLVQTADFKHVNLKFYESDQYFPDDLKPVWEREAHWNINRIKRLARLLPNPKKRRILDFGCGIGGFLKRVEGQFGSIVGFDLSKRQCDLINRDGAVCFSQLEDVPKNIDTVALFHVLEHTVEPWTLLRDIVAKFKHVDRVVIEVPNTNEVLLSLFNNKAYQHNHYSSEHVYYFTNATLRAVAERAGLRVLIDDQMQRYTLGNTFGWLANGRGGGQDQWTRFNDPDFHAEYEKILALSGIADSVFLICEPVR